MVVALVGTEVETAGTGPVTATVTDVTCGVEVVVTPVGARPEEVVTVPSRI